MNGIAWKFAIAYWAKWRISPRHIGIYGNPRLEQATTNQTQIKLRRNGAAKMPLIVEDGRCPQFANSYISRADADNYLVSRGLWSETPVIEESIPDATDNDASESAKQDNATQPPAVNASFIPDQMITASKEAALIRAFDFLNTLKWKGNKPCWKRCQLGRAKMCLSLA